MNNVREIVVRAHNQMLQEIARLENRDGEDDGFVMLTLFSGNYLSWNETGGIARSICRASIP